MSSTWPPGQYEKERLSACQALFHASIEAASMNAFRSATNQGAGAWQWAVH